MGYFASHVSNLLFAVFVKSGSLTLLICFQLGDVFRATRFYSALLYSHNQGS